MEAFGKLKDLKDSVKFGGIPATRPVGEIQATCRVRLKLAFSLIEKCVLKEACLLMLLNTLFKLILFYCKIFS